jgi:hypothetical protein
MWGASRHEALTSMVSEYINAPWWERIWDCPLQRLTRTEGNVLRRIACFEWGRGQALFAAEDEDATRPVRHLRVRSLGALLTMAGSSAPLSGSLLSIVGVCHAYKEHAFREWVRAGDPFIRKMKVPLPPVAPGYGHRARTSFYYV